MGNTFGFMKPQSRGGFQFMVLDSCKAEGIDLNETCGLHFGPNHQLLSIGNITKGEMTPRPGIAGQGIWLGMLSLFAVIVVAFVFVAIEIVSRFELSRKLASNGRVLKFVYYFKDPPDEDVDDPERKIRYRARIRAGIRGYVLGASDAQTILVAAFILSFAAQEKCQLTSYHFTVAADMMTISLSVLVFSVALVRTYWRNPWAATFRVLLSIGAFIGVGLTIFGENNYSPEWPPPQNRHDSAILLPVACLLETDLWSRTKKQAEDHQADLGFQNSPSRWPTERFFYIVLVFAFLIAHASIGVRRWEGRHGEGNPGPRLWTNARGWFTTIYWLVVLLIPTVASVWVWNKVRIARVWVKDSGWIEDPNPEFNLWDSGQLIPLGAFILILMTMLTELKSRKGEADNRKNGHVWARISERDGGLELGRMPGARSERHPTVPVPLSALGY
ncbi:uncharacterized protein BDZ99DRAFT_527870 [Mytilinidion resinicola]|uniref:Uncharacterized protein n=1 Tax=Mytilinidion resinicola TaxID=574789 RepID=A0A6A6XZA6_9PEZI|nr:uncharacterized protein BDZ99DRAFT_527870 [Mytilinidion resinicola]KAF2801906.1 hypothetical protein BDZ99DRAFT_527870 [Mytilinidion resinicola]